MVRVFWVNWGKYYVERELGHRTLERIRAQHMKLGGEGKIRAESGKRKLGLWFDDRRSWEEEGSAVEDDEGESLAVVEGEFSFVLFVFVLMNVCWWMCVVVLYFRSCTRFGVCIILHKCCGGLCCRGPFCEV